MAEYFFCNAPEKKAFDPTPAMCGHRNHVNIHLSSVVQDFFCVIPIPDMAIHLKSLSFESLFYLVDVFLRFPNGFYLALSWINT